jgi:uncharacterized membrane protein YbhN (UPF0104 family)
MQYSLANIISKATSNKVNIWLLKCIFFTISIGWLYFKLDEKRIFSSFFIEILVKAGAHPLVWVCMLLMFFNWGIESFKWQYLIQKLFPITFQSALRGVFTGVCFGFITPHGLGDYAGRILQLNTEKKLQAIGALFISRISQFVITIVAGSVAIFMLLYNDILVIPNVAYQLSVQLIVIGNVLLILALIYFKKIARILKNKITKPVFQLILKSSSKDFSKIILLSTLRYAVFSIQYFLLLIYFDIQCDFTVLFCGIAFIFLVKSIVPTFFDIGVREAAATLYFSYFVTNIDGVIMASLTLWIINLVIPSIVGAFLIFKIK